jgi:hypothetical protein
MKQGYTIGTFLVLRTFKKYTYRDLVQGDKPPETPNRLEPE